MLIMSKIFKKISWWNLVPDSAILVSPQIGNVAARSKDGDWLIAYLSKPEKIMIDSRFLPFINHIEAIWINPETGEVLNAILIPTQNTIDFEPPKWIDAVLVVKGRK